MWTTVRPNPKPTRVAFLVLFTPRTSMCTAWPFANVTDCLVEGLNGSDWITYRLGMTKRIVARPLPELRYGGVPGTGNTRTELQK